MESLCVELLTSLWADVCLVQEKERKRLEEEAARLKKIQEELERERLRKEEEERKRQQEIEERRL